MFLPLVSKIFALRKVLSAISISNTVSQATRPYYPFNGTTVEDFVIGSETECPASRDYCNGPLKAGATYKVKIRAYTASDKFADTYYSHSIPTGEWCRQAFLIEVC